MPLGQATAMYDALAAAGAPISLYEARVTDGVYLCRPACGALPIGPAGHEVGLFDAFALVEHRVAGLGDRGEPAIHGTCDGRMGSFDPDDVPDRS